MYRMRVTVLTLLVMLLAGMGTAAEFQPLGAVGIGGAGVARMRDGFAPYWNPAGLAFNEKIVSVRINAGAGVRLNNGLAENLDDLSNIDFDALNQDVGTISASQLTEAVKLLSLLEKIDRENGAITVNGSAAFGIQVKHFGMGAYGTFEAAAVPGYIDTTNILFGGTLTPATARSEMAAAAVGAPASNSYFTVDQRTQISSALTSSGYGAPNDIINLVDAQLAASGIPSGDATAALVNLAALTANAATTGQLVNNQTNIIAAGLGLVEVPIAYGHPIKLGKNSTLGIGASVKAMRGRVYLSSTQVFTPGSATVNSTDIVDNIRDRFNDSSTFGVDAGLLWQYKKSFAVGVVGKNLNTPKFEAENGFEVKVEPQARMGLSWTPAKWIEFAADVDLTENKTILEGYKSRHLGGGLELHPWTWLRLRGGAYKNLAEEDIGTVATAGFTLGMKWFYLDINGAYGLESGYFDGDRFPREARAEGNLNIQF